MTTKVIGRTAVWLLTLLLLTGCTRVVGGTVQPAAGLRPEPLSSRAVRQALLDDAELSKKFSRSFQSHPDFPPRYGTADDLPDAWAAGTPHDCVGAAVGLQKSVYQPHDAQDIAEEYWRDSGSSGLMVNEGVVTLPATGDADALFAEFAEQWEQCDGVTVTRNDPKQSAATGEITDVKATDSVVEATVRTTVSGRSGMLVARAVGVRVNCVVDVEVLYFESDSPTEPAAMAGDIARAIMAKVGALG